jgi:hypothetical protein
MNKPTNKPKPKTAISIKQLFRERMGREGHAAEFRAAVKKVMQLRNLKYGQAVPEAMRNMGYEGPERERQHEREWIQGMDVERAMCYLPPSASPEVENDWVLAHPALNRKNLTDNNGKVEIKAWDLFFAPHGRCPSMRSANKLIAWANDSKEMRSHLAAGIKKTETTAEKGKPSDEVKDDGLAEVERLLNEVM